MIKKVHNIFRSRAARSVFALALFSVLVFAPVVSFAQTPPPPIVPSPFTSPTSGATVNSPSFSQCIGGWWNIFGGNNIACAIDSVTYYIYALAGDIIRGVFYFVNIALAFTYHITDNPVVRGGYDAVLAIANLGFVLGIIAIAISTILGFKSYGAKQLIWRFIIIALLVNFSFLACGIIIQAADQVTKAFVSDIGLNIENGDFANSMATAFSYPSFYTTKSGGGSESAAARAKCVADKLNTIPAGRLPGGVTAPPLDPILAACGDKSIMSSLASMLFAIVFMFIFALTAGALAVMLFIRYAYLSILIIIAPVAWLFYIFPTFSHYTKQWWNLFIKYVLFAPMMIFFLYLAISVAQNQKAYVDKWSGTAINPPPNPTATTLAASLSSSDGPVGNLANKILLIVLMMGGLYAAQSLSIKGASTAVGIATNTRKRVQRAATNYTRDRAVRAGSVVAGAVEPLTTKMQTAGANWSQTKEGGLKGWGKFAGGWTARGITKATGIRAAGRAVQDIGVKGGEDLVAKRARELPKTWEQIRNQIISQDAAGKVASAEYAYKNKKLHEVDPALLADRKMFESLGKGKLHEDIRNATLEINEANKKKEAAEALAKAGAEAEVAEKEAYAAAEKEAPARLQAEVAEKEKAAYDSVYNRSIDQGIDEATAKLDAEKAKSKAGFDAVREFSAPKAAQKSADEARNKVLGTVTIMDENGQPVNAKEYLDNANAKLLANMSKSDVSKGTIAKIYEKAGQGEGFWDMSPGATKEIADSIGRSVAQSGGNLTGTVAAQLKGAQLPKFQSAFEEWVHQSHLDEKKKEELLRRIHGAIGNSAMFAGGFDRDERRDNETPRGGGGAKPT